MRFSYPFDHTWNNSVRSCSDKLVYVQEWQNLYLILTGLLTYQGRIKWNSTNPTVWSRWSSKQCREMCAWTLPLTCPYYYYLFHSLPPIFLTNKHLFEWNDWRNIVAVTKWTANHVSVWSMKQNLQKVIFACFSNICKGQNVSTPRYGTKS